MLLTTTSRPVSRALMHLGVALTLLAGLLVAPRSAAAELTGTATITDASRPRTNTFASTLDEGFVGTTRVLMETLDAGTTTWREWGMELGQSATFTYEDYNFADVVARELLVENTGGSFSNGLTGYSYASRTSNGRQSRNVAPGDVTAPTTFTGDDLQAFSTKENGGLLVELTFARFTADGDGLLQRAAIAGAEFRIEILSRDDGDEAFRLPTLNELVDVSISDQVDNGDLPGTLSGGSTTSLLGGRATGITLFHCDPTLDDPVTDGCVAEIAGADGAIDPAYSDSDVSGIGDGNGGSASLVGVAQAYARANANGKAWLWLTGPTTLDYMIRIADQRVDRRDGDDGFDVLPLVTSADTDVTFATPIAESRIIRVFSEQDGYAFEGNNPSASAAFTAGRRTTNYFAKRDDTGTTLLNYRGLIPDAPVDVYLHRDDDGSTTTSTFNCLRTIPGDLDTPCVRPEPPITPVAFNGGVLWDESYTADVDDAYFPYNDHGAVGVYEFVPNCDRLDLSASSLTVDQALVAYQNNDGSGGADGDAPRTTVRAQLYNSCGEPYRGPSRTFDITIPDEANPGSSRTVSVTTDSRGLATTTIIAPLNSDGNDAAATSYVGNVSTDFGVEGGIDGDPTTTTVNFYGPNTPSIANSTLTMLRSSAIADDTDVTTAVVQLRNLNDAAVGAGTRVCLSFAFEPAEGVSQNAWTAPVPPGDPTPDFWETDATGRVEVDMPSPTTGTVTVTAADDPCGTAGTVADGATIGSAGGVTGTYTAGDPAADEADVAIADERIDPDGSSTTTVTVTVRDANGNPVGAGEDVCLEFIDNADDTPSTGTLAAGPWTTDENGRITALVTSPEEDGAATIYAWLGTCASKGAGIGQVQVTYEELPPAPPADPGGPLLCTPDPVAPGARVDCTFAGGNPDFAYLWRASSLGDVFATAGMTTIADGSGGFSFVVPAAYACEDVLVELVDWNISTLIQVLCPRAPTSIPAGGGSPSSTPALLLMVGLAGLALIGTSRLRSGSGTR